MLFNSFDFALFFPLFFLFYWFVFNRSLRLQNVFILASSYFFYACWDWKFLFLIAISSLVDFNVGIFLGKTDSKTQRKALLLISILVNLGLLGFFKYYNFFLDNFEAVFRIFGRPIDVDRLNIILPVGISFYTFQTLGYTIDVFKKKIQPEKDFISFFAFVSFFPQLVAGPIERAQNLLPQFRKKRIFNYDKAVDGLRLVLWGFFKKVVIADNCAIVVNDIVTNYQDVHPSYLIIGIVFFAFQVYGDFSGYSDIAIGIAKIIGFKLTTNFQYPFLSRDIAELWRRWHITLTTWFRDYVYIPLGGSRVAMWRILINVLIIFLISGFWHGATWTYIFWGLMNAILFIPLLVFGKHRKNLDNIPPSIKLPGLKLILQMTTNFIVWAIVLHVLRSHSIQDSYLYLKTMLIDGLIMEPRNVILSLKAFAILPVTYFILILMICEWFQRDKTHPLVFRGFFKQSKILRWITYQSIVFAILYFGHTKQEFFYFQF